ncbi:hypothetical protein ACOMHN_032729 [Nucella lapillus]
MLVHSVTLMNTSKQLNRALLRYHQHPQRWLNFGRPCLLALLFPPVEKWIQKSPSCVVVTVGMAGALPPVQLWATLPPVQMWVVLPPVQLWVTLPPAHLWVTLLPVWLRVDLPPAQLWVALLPVQLWMALLPAQLWMTLLPVQLFVALSPVQLKDVSKLRDENRELRGRLTQHGKEDGELHQQLNDQEQHGRLWNVRVYGVQENKEETIEDCVQKCVDIFTQKVGVTVNKSDIEMAHRSGRPGGSKARPILARFFSWGSKARPILARFFSWGSKARPILARFFSWGSKARPILARFFSWGSKARPILARFFSWGSKARPILARFFSWGSKARPILARFFSRRLRSQVLANKRKLKQTGITVGGDLTITNYKTLKKAQAHSACFAALSTNGKVLAKLKNREKLKIDTHTDIQEIFSKSISR